MFRSLIYITAAAIYPFCLAFGFGEIGHSYAQNHKLQCIFLCETFALCDMMMNFFIAYKNEDSESFELDFVKIRKKYISGIDNYE